MNSEFMQINVRDLLHGLVITVVSAILTGLLGLLQSGTNFGVPELKSMLVVAIISGISYLAKKLTTDERGKILGRL